MFFAASGNVAAGQAVGEAPANPRWSQLADLGFQHLTVEQGLPHPAVTAIAEDGDGFLWVGTQGGLARWDGYRFRRFFAVPNDPNSLHDNFIHTLYTDSLGRLWVGTNGGGLARYDREHEHFITISTGPNQLSHTTVKAIVDDGQKGLWLGTAGGLDHLTASLTDVRHLRHQAQDPHSLPDNRVQSLLRDKNGTLWVGTQRGLTRKDGEGEHFTPITLPESAGQQPAIIKLFQSNDGNIWIGTTKQGVYILNPVSGDLQTIGQLSPDLAALSNETVFAIVETKPGQFWLGSYGLGIFVYDAKTKQVQRIYHNDSLTSSLTNDSVWAIHLGRSGLLWLGSVGGLDRHYPLQTAILTLLGSTNRQDGIAGKNIHSAQEMANGKIWLGHDTGIDILDPANRQIQRMRTTPTHADTRPSQAMVTAITPSVDNEIYFCTHQGVFVSNLLEPSFKTRQAVNAQHDRTESCRTLLRERNSLWIGYHTEGLAQYVIDKPLDSTRIAGLSDQRVTAIEPGAHDSLWVGTQNGLNLYNRNSHRVEQVIADTRNNATLSANFISSLVTDRQGRLWVGTLGGGISVLIARSAQGVPQFRQIGTAQGLPSTNIGKLLLAKDGKIWASSARGVIMIDPITFAIRSYQGPEGLLIQNYWVGSGSVTGGGELLFGGQGGLTIIRPEQFKDWDYLPPIVVTDVRVGGQPIPASYLNSSVKPMPIAIAAEANSLAIEFSALDYSAPEQNRYAYRLDGYDKDWINTDSTRRLAAYTNLPPGDYRLLLRGSNRNGVFNDKQLLIPVKVFPAWYQSWWFRLAELLIGLALLYALLQGRTTYLRRRQHELESQVVLRTRELHEKQTELLGANADLALSADTLRQLGDMGRDITANLETKSVFESLHRHVGKMLDAPFVSIYRMNPDGNTLTRNFGREDGEPLPDNTVAIDSPTSLTAHAARDRREILLELPAGQQGQSHIPGTRNMITALFAPLSVDERLLGVMSIQSEREHAYGERERLIFRTLCAYGAIALANAESLHALRQTQAQLVQHEKMASLGILTAGIAHEINNPTNFAYVGASNLTNELTKFKGFLFELAGDDTPKEILSSIQQRFDAVEGHMQCIREGTTRIRNLVKDLRVFSRLDEAAWKPVAIGDSLISTINLVRTRYAHSTEIRCELTANPILDCWPAELNQVFMNLIVNACQAIQSQQKKRVDYPHGLLHIRSRIEGQQLVLEFEDNGGGIPQTALGHIFDPFFTTKEVGEGTGLGLSISFGIIEKHHGSIKVKTLEGQGTCFSVYLPTAH